MAKCLGTKRDSTQCTADVLPPQRYCWWHDPKTAGERKKAAAKGGKGRLTRRISPLWERIEKVITAVEKESLSPQQGNTMLKGYATMVGLARIEIDQKRLELDVEEREEIRPLIQAVEDQHRRTR